MSRVIRYFIVGLFLFCEVSDRCTADDSSKLGIHEIVQVDPSNHVLHGLDTRSTIDSGQIWTQLRGPKMFSQSRPIDGQKNQRPGEHLVWYKIQNAKQPKTIQLSLKHPFEAEETLQVSIGKSAFLLCPATVLRNGPPQEIPETLNFLKAYEVLDGPTLSSQIQLASSVYKSSDPATRSVAKVRYICLPAEQWHHDEFEPINDESRLMILCDSSKPDSSKPDTPLSPKEDVVTVIDQFGLNRLAHQPSEWIAIDTEIAD